MDSIASNDVHLVTIVINCFNNAAWANEAILSAKTQTYPLVELIIIDDGSSDDTAAVCAQHPEVRYIWQQNAGLSSARNTGLRAAAGRFVCFLDGDDVLRPDAIARGVEALEANSTWAFVYGGHLTVGADRTLISEVRSDPGQANYRSLLRQNVVGMHATVLYRRAVLEQEGGFDTSLRAAEDYDMLLRVASRHPIGCHDGIIAEYRKHDRNMSRDPVLMLTNALLVLKSQARHVGGSVEDRRAWREGLAKVETNYGKQMVIEALRNLAVPGRRAKALKSLDLARQIAPRGLASAALAGLWRGVERSLPIGLRRLLRRAARSAQAGTKMP
jgi:hypothetical protein